MSKLGDALNATSRTENGAVQYETTTSRCLDFFQMAGSARKAQQSEEDMRKAWQLAYSEDADLAVRALLWAYDCRGGAGCRDVMKAMLPLILLKHDQKQGLAILRAIPELGRYDMLADLLNHDDLPLTYVFQIIGIFKDALADKGKAPLCAKWLPREGKAANRIRGRLHLTPKEYRHTLSQYTTTETQMSAKKWNKIEYRHVPSVCMARNRKAFDRHDPVRFGKFNDRVLSGQEKVHAGVVYPHDIIRSLLTGYVLSTVPEATRKAAQAQWMNLPDYLADTGRSIMPIVDVSGSMHVSVSGRIRAIDIATSLGAYCAERQRSAFKDEVLCFSGRPKMTHLKGDIYNRLQQMLDTPDECNTDLAKAVKKIVHAAKSNNMTQEDLPDVLLIMSDMQFDEMSSYSTNGSCPAHKFIDKTFTAAGYRTPVIVYWNLASRHTEGTPVKADDNGTIMVSGFSPAILKAVLSGTALKQIDPAQAMLTTLLVDRYDLSKY